MLKCECGKEFDYSQSFNGHKRHCKIHLAAVGKLESYKSSSIKFQQAAAKYRTDKSLAIQNSKKEQNALDQELWVSEKHFCERCGCLMTYKFGSGRFCSRSCSNAHSRTLESKYKSSQAANPNKYLTFDEFEAAHKKQKRSRVIKLYDTKVCKVCGNLIDNKRAKYSNYCSNKCGGFEHRGGARETVSRGHRGSYKAIHCDSTYELAFLVYCLDHNIQIERNTERFVYKGLDNKLHRYLPDFFLPDTNTYVEIKGYERAIDSIKAAALGSNNYIYLNYESLLPIFQYLSTKYDWFKYSKTFNNLYLLYD